MPFAFTRLFFVLLALGLLPLSLSWNAPVLRWAALGCNILLIALAIVDWRLSALPADITFTRRFARRFAIKDKNTIRIVIENKTVNGFRLRIKDEYPPELRLSGERQQQVVSNGQTITVLEYDLTPYKRGEYAFGATVVRSLSKFRLVWCQTACETSQTIKVYPNLRRAQEVELATLGAQSQAAMRRRSFLRGEGRDFESLREYVRGDEMRHLSWTATARRGKLVTRQYQIERDQNIVIALDAGRLMTGRIEDESKFDTAIQAALSLMSAAVRGGDNVGIVVFKRQAAGFLPVKRGTGQLEAALEMLYKIEPEMIEPSYARAFEFIAANCKRRSLVVVLTDVVDEVGSKELVESFKLLRPRHLPVAVTIGDRDLRAVVQQPPSSTANLFAQAVSDEILHQRETSLREIEMLGCLTLDVTTKTLAPSLLKTYLQIKERGLL